EGLAQTEHEGTRNIVVVPSIDLFQPDQCMDFSYLNLQAVADGGKIFTVDLLGVKLGSILPWLVVRTGPREPGLGSITEPCAKTHPVHRTACRGRFFVHDLCHLRHK